MKQSFDFIEIGTSDFDTLIQTCGEDARGLSVDMMQHYLDRLVSKPNVIKVCAGITGLVEPPSDSDDALPKSVTAYHIHPDDIEKHHMPFWLRGCNSIMTPHPTAVKYLESRNLRHLYRETQVPMLTIKELFDTYDVGSVKYLKLDTEGHDCAILGGLLEMCRLNPQRWPGEILFECNVLTPTQVVDNVINSLIREGYTLVRRDESDALMRRSVPSQHEHA
jgi:hypothetical protein